MPHIILIAGPNGAGKSTSAPGILHGALAVSQFVNADTIALGLSAFANVLLHQRTASKRRSAGCT